MENLGLHNHRLGKQMATQADIESHYDVDNDFFALFLDKKYRAYSCGVWKNATDLEYAQEAKLDRICRYANVKAHQHVTDVGWRVLYFFS